MCGVLRFRLNMKLNLIKYMDSPSENYTYFWVEIRDDGMERVVSDIFKSEDEAQKWLEYIKKMYSPK